MVNEVTMASVFGNSHLHRELGAFNGHMEGRARVLPARARNHDL